MKVLIVSWSFPPVSSPRAFKADAIVRELLDLGHSVSLLTSQYKGSDIDHKLRESLNKVYVIDRNLWPTFKVSLEKSLSWKSTHKYKRLINGALLKILSYPDIQVFFKVVKALSSFNENYDLCISVDGPQQIHWAVAFRQRFMQLRCKKWIADCGDPLTRNVNGNMVAPYFKLIEDFFCRSADVITVPVDEGYGYFRSSFQSKIHVVKHSIRFPDTKDWEDDDGRRDSKVYFAYAGNILPYQKQAHELFQELNKEVKDFQFDIFGPNELFKETVKTRYPALIGKVNFVGVIDRNTLLRKLRSYNFLVYFPYPSTGQVPFKLIDYDFVGIPVLKYESSVMDAQMLREFMEGNYNNRSALPSYKYFKSSLTVQNYLGLV